MSEDAIDRMLNRARETPVPPSDAFLAQVLADAYDHQPQPQATARPSPPARRGLWSVFVSSLGGPGVLAGLATAAVTGLFFGYANPSALSWLTNQYFDVSGDSVELLPGSDLFATEG